MNIKHLRQAYPYTVLSLDHQCQICKRGIKKRLTIQKQRPPKLCFNHWIAKKSPQSSQQPTRPNTAKSNTN